MDGEGRSSSFAIARHLDAATMNVNELLHDGQTQSQPAMFPRRRRLGLTEALEHVRQKLRRDTCTCVAHGNLHVGFHLRERDTHVATRQA